MKEVANWDDLRSTTLIYSIWCEDRDVSGDPEVRDVSCDLTDSVSALSLRVKPLSILTNTRC